MANNDLSWQQKLIGLIFWHEILVMRMILRSSSKQWCMIPIYSFYIHLVWLIMNSTLLLTNVSWNITIYNIQLVHQNIWKQIVPLAQILLGCLILKTETNRELFLMYDLGTNLWICIDCCVHFSNKSDGLVSMLLHCNVKIL